MQQVSPSEVAALQEKMQRVKSEVLQILDRYPETRNNDFMLLWYFLRYRRGLKLPFLTSQQIEDLDGLPETIRRQRQKIQNEEGLYEPTDPKVWEERQAKAERMRKILASKKPKPQGF